MPCVEIDTGTHTEMVDVTLTLFWALLSMGTRPQLTTPYSACLQIDPA